MASITQQLGLSRATISKAVKRLVELGLVTTEWADGRSKYVCLTAEGCRRIRQALHLVFTGRKLTRHLKTFFAAKTGLPPRGAGWRKRISSAANTLLDVAWWQTRDAARHLNDSSEPLYIQLAGVYVD